MANNQILLRLQPSAEGFSFVYQSRYQTSYYPTEQEEQYHTFKATVYGLGVCRKMVF